MRPALVVHEFGAFIGVLYPYRKTPDLYVAVKGEPVFCAQCEATFPLEEMPQHIQGHDRRLLKRHSR